MWFLGQARLRSLRYWNYHQKRGGSLKKAINILFVSVFLLLPKLLLAENATIPTINPTDPSQSVAKPLVLICILLAISLSPFLIMMTTSFVKISVVLALVRNAIGTQQIPPNPIITGLAMILTIYIMIPVGKDIYAAAGSTINQGSKEPVMSQMTVSLLVKASQESKEPLRQFLMKHAHLEERSTFFRLSRDMRKEGDKAEVTDKDFEILIPAFVISELTEAFQIGFIIFLPFLVIDVVVTNILLSLGMFQLSPVTVSLPFKLLLFVLVHGWELITEGLIKGYQ